MFDCPCTAVIHCACAIKWYWKAVVAAHCPSQCPACRAKVSLLLVHRTRWQRSDGEAELSSADLEVEIEFAGDAPNLESSDEEEAAQEAVNTADAADQAAANVQPLEHRAIASPVDGMSVHSSDEDFIAPSEDEESDTSSSSAAAPSSSEEEEAGSTTEDEGSEEAYAPWSTDSSESEAEEAKKVGTKRKRT